MVCSVFAFCCLFFRSVFSCLVPMYVCVCCVSASPSPVQIVQIAASRRSDGAEVR